MQPYKIHNVRTAQLVSYAMVVLLRDSRPTLLFTEEKYARKVITALRDLIEAYHAQ
jgi:hypothetical protein